MWYHNSLSQLEKRYFCGKLKISDAVMKLLSVEEILVLYRFIQALVKQKDGISQTQEFINEKGVKLFFIDEKENCLLCFSSEV